MMRVLIVKTSSLGDVLNTLPALTDAAMHFPDIQFDWVVEPAFSEVPQWLQSVNRIIPVALRQWRKHPIKAWQNGEWQQFYQQLRQEKYDYVIDAQGLIKSAFLTFLAHGLRCGYDKHSAWEPIACLAYQRCYGVNPKQHAITRIRQLFAQSLGYPIPIDFADCGLDKSKLPPLRTDAYCVFLHGTARTEKCWPEQYWLSLIALMKNSDYKILLPWGNNKEKQRAEHLAVNQPHVEVLPKLTLTELARILNHSTANVAVDTGLGHLAAALNVPTISLYGPTFPALNGTVGQQQIHLKKNQLTDITPEEVYKQLRTIIEN